jgi:excinuclease UvrABC nuclease subunit
MPCIATVYVMVDEEGEIKYIGHSNNLRRRIAQHTNSPRMQKLGWTHVMFFEPQIRDVAQRLETEGILTLRACPPGNQMVSLRRTKEQRWIELKKSPFIVKNAVRQVKIGSKKYQKPPANG